MPRMINQTGQKVPVKEAPEVLVRSADVTLLISRMGEHVTDQMLEAAERIMDAVEASK